MLRHSRKYERKKEKKLHKYVDENPLRRKGPLKNLLNKSAPDK